MELHDSHSTREYSVGSSPEKAQATLQVGAGIALLLAGFIVYIDSNIVSRTEEVTLSLGTFYHLLESLGLSQAVITSGLLAIGLYEFLTGRIAQYPPEWRKER